MTDELEPDRMRSLHERMERQLAADVDVDATWARVRERMATSKVVPFPLRRRSRRVIVLAIAAALVVSGSALAGMRQLTTDPGHPAPGAAHAPTLAPTTDHEKGTGASQGTTSSPTTRGTPVDQTDDPSQDDGDRSVSPSQGDDGTGSGGQDGSSDQVDQSGSSGDQSVQDSDHVDGGGQTSDSPSSDGGADLSGGG